jgi:hypothetical protein
MTEKIKFNNIKSTIILSQYYGDYSLILTSFLSALAVKSTNLRYITNTESLSQEVKNIYRITKRVC